MVGHPTFSFSYLVKKLHPKFKGNFNDSSVLMMVSDLDAAKKQLGEQFKGEIDHPLMIQQNEA